MAIRKIDDALQKLVEAESKKSELEKKIVEYKRAIADYMDAKDMQTYECNITTLDEVSDRNRNVRYKITRSDAMSVEYHLDKLAEKLDEDLIKELTCTTYVLNDPELLKKLFKKAGYTPNDFKKCVSTIKSVNGAKLQQMFSIGEITLKDIKGCYTAKISKRLLIRKLKKGDNE